MKICAACDQDLPKASFSKKQWQLKQQLQRRCKECIAMDRNIPSHNELNDRLHNKWEKEWRAILDDPESTKSMRDAAISQLNDNVGIGDVLTGKSRIEMKISSEVAANGSWILVEDFEEGTNWSPNFGNVVVSTAAEEILSREIEDGRGQLGLSNRGLQNDGSFDFYASYPKLIKTCTMIIDGSVDNELKSNAYTVMSHLRAQLSFDLGGEAMADLKKAVKLNPSDWRLHSALATRNMAVYNTALALESITRALELTTDNFASFSLGIRKGKILFNLGDNYQGAIEAFEDAITLYDNGLKCHRQMSDKLIGRLAVAEYMLVILYGKQGEHKKAVNHYRDAEKKRDSIDEGVSKTIDWSNRMLAEVVIADIRPGNLAQGECHNCGEITDKPLRCSACKAVFYCGKNCQLNAWKNGHKKECKQLKSERREKESTANQEFKIEQSRVNLLPLDANLDPNGLWKEGVQLSEKGEFEEAAWKFLLALFMNAALDANDMKPVILAVEACNEDDPVIMALSVVSTYGGGKRCVQRAEEMYERARTMESTFINVDMSTTLEDVDRRAFGLGMCFIMYARKIGIVFSCKSAADARRTETRDAFDDVAKLVMNSKQYIDPRRWLTLHFELGYTNMDVGALIEGEKWLKLFTTKIESTESFRTNRGSKQHWLGMKSSAESRLQQLSLMKMMSGNNPGFLQDCETGGEECSIM